MKYKIIESYKTATEEKVAELFSWMESNEGAEKDAYDEKQKSVVAVASW